MRRRLKMLVVPLLAVAIGSAFLPWMLKPSVSSVKRETVTVTIVFQCEGTRSVSPWELKLRPGDDVDWVLDPSSDVTEFEIEKKRALGRWPFRTDRPRGRPGEPARGREMKQDARGRYQYNIVAECPGPGNSRRKAIIDPDIIIEPDTD